MVGREGQRECEVWRIEARMDVIVVGNGEVRGRNEDAEGVLSSHDVRRGE